MPNIGYTWLAEHYQLPAMPLRRTSQIGGRIASRSVDGVVAQTWTAQYDVAPNWSDQLEFALKYDGTDLAFLATLFRHITPEEVAEAQRQTPNGVYLRRIAFLYEWLTGREVPNPAPIAAGYDDALSPDEYVVATGDAVENVQKWRIRNNLPGTPAFCPTISKTPEVVKALEWRPALDLEAMARETPADIFERAISYLYFSETRSTNQIENETPTTSKAERFVQQLRNAGTQPLEESLRDESLEDLQASFVSPTDAGIYMGVRVPGMNNWVGHTAGTVPRLDYPCPTGDRVESLMDGWREAMKRSAGADPMARAAIASFSIAYIHPFMDGNGRLSRYLIHDAFAREGFAPKGAIFPVSAVLLKHLDGYKRSLETHSRPILRMCNFDLDPAGELTIFNADELDPLWRYPNLTENIVFLQQMTQICAETELPAELQLLTRMGEAKNRVLEKYDVPERDINLLLGMIHQNGGRLSKNKREGHFARLSDDLVAAAERIYGECVARNEPKPKQEFEGPR